MGGFGTQGFDGSKSNSVKVEGAEELQRKLLAIPGIIERKYLGAAMRKAVKPLEAALAANTPVGPTGNLRRSVASRVKNYSSGVAFGVVGYKRAVSEDSDDNKGYHSHLIEFGTNERRPRRAPFLSSFSISDWRPPGWVGDWPMVAKKVRGVRAMHPLGNAYVSVGNRCMTILISELYASLGEAVDDAGSGR